MNLTLPEKVVDGHVLRKIPGYSHYWITCHGYVWCDEHTYSSGRGKKLVQTELAKWKTLGIDKDGYKTVALQIEGRSKTRKVHRLVAECWIGPVPKDKPWVLHKNNSKDEFGAKNNHYLNLYYGTPKQNSADRINDGNSPEGEKNGFAKLTEEQVVDIFHSKEKTRTLSLKHNVSTVRILQIKAGFGWKHLNLGGQDGSR